MWLDSDKPFPASEDIKVTEPLADMMHIETSKVMIKHEYKSTDSAKIDGVKRAR